MAAKSVFEVSAGVSSAMGAASKALRSSTREALVEAGRLARTNATAAARLSAGADRRFSRWRAPALGARTRSEPGAVEVSPVGPWKVAEVGAAPHRAKAWGRGEFNHPGTRASQGRQGWTRARDKTFDALDIEQRVGDAVEDGFKEG